MATYELALLGAVTLADQTALTATIGAMLDDFALRLGSDVLLHDASGLAGRDRRSAFAAVYFGGTTWVDGLAIDMLLRERAPIIPTVRENEDFSRLMPPALRPLNGHVRPKSDSELVELATIMLESIGLLRQQRRAFVSYRRNESRLAALQLHDLLTARGLDVFLDTHSIRPGDPFQEILWQRLCDSDVLVMLDTSSYFESRWTEREWGRALAKEIHIMRIVWPGHAPKRATEMAETVYLDPLQLKGPDGPLDDEKAGEIVIKVERLRSRSVAARHMSIAGKLIADALRIGATVDGIGAHRAITIGLPDSRKVLAYPVVGIPTAQTLNDISEKARRADHHAVPALVYDHIGIGELWGSHLRWLDDNIKCVRTIKASEAAWTLAAWE